MPTKTETATSEVATTETTTEKLSVEETLILSDKVNVDPKFKQLMVSIDTHQLKVGGKWATLIDYVKDKYGDEDNKESRHIVLKSIMAVGRTYKSAQSIRSYIYRMARPENAEALAKLRAGEITVRASREAGRTRQSGEAVRRSTNAKLTDSLDKAASYAGALNLTVDEFLAKARKAFDAYASQAEKAEAAKEAAKAAKKS